MAFETAQEMQTPKNTRTYEFKDTREATLSRSSVETIRLRWQTREERKEAEDLEPNAASAPEVHLVRVVAIRQKALRSAIPSDAAVPS